MMGGVSSPTAMTGRVKEIAKSLSAFMELAKEPDVVRAIQTMGSLRASGLNLQETMSAVSAGRTYARMAGTTFANVAEMGGSMGSQTMQSMGLSQGVGFRAGMANYGIAASGMNSGVINPQLASLVGGAQGLGTLNTMFSGAMLQHPMVTPGMMGAAGGLDANAIQRMMSGQSNMFDMTGRGSGVLGGMAGRYGAAGLGMAVAMQPMLQDSLGRMIQAQGSFAGRNMEDRQVLAMARQMGMHGSQGYLTAAQAMGMDRNQALTRATEMSSPTYWSNQRGQLDVERREARANNDREEEQDASSLGGTLYRHTGIGRALRAGRGAAHAVGMHFTGGREGQIEFGGAMSDSDRRELSAGYGSQSYRRYMERNGATAPSDGLLDRLSHGYDYSSAMGSEGIAAGLGSIIRLGTDSAHDRAIQRQELRSGGEFATEVLASTRAQRRRALGQTNALFGSSEGLQQFASSLNSMSATYGGERSLLGAGFNGAVRGAAQFYSMGTFDPGNVVGGRSATGSDIEARYRATMRRQGKSEDEITQLWRSQRSGIAAAAGDMMETYGMTPEQREVWQQTQRRVGGDSGSSDDGGRRNIQRAYRSVLGDRGRGAQEGYEALHGEAEGLGREGTARHARTRNIITAAAAANLLATQGTSTEQERAHRLSRTLFQGLSGEEQAQVNQRVQALAGRNRGNEGALEAARGLVGSGDANTLLERMGAADETLANAKRARDAGTGFAAMSRQGGMLANVLRGAVGRNGYDREAVQHAFQNMTPDQIRALREEGSGGARIADLARRGNFTEIERIAGRMGEDGDRQRRSWTEEHSGRIRAFETAANIYSMNPILAPWKNRIREGARGLVDRMRESAVADTLTPHSAQERQAMLSGRDSASAQSEAEGSGMGRAGDALLEASRELRRASEQLSNSTLVGAVSNLVGSNTPTP
jgi:hypothetical protein